jgi:hypothetical protein
MSTWLKQRPIKNRLQPLPRQTALLPIGTLARGRGTQNKSIAGVQNNISIAISVHLEQGNLLSQRAPFLFLQHSANGPHHERAVKLDELRVLGKF